MRIVAGLKNLSLPNRPTRHRLRGFVGGEEHNFRTPTLVTSHLETTILDFAGDESDTRALPPT